ncbi:uncharacterized protein FIESC28_01261 [Fusarium coffeatum]|uniref:FAD dependent oxidoreductase domain-containing protein n=1 Tax=Fusarium coffeatum TaxID=231269 RepID=A0A366SAQ1_9HYPO|nr:uncharacterized protein FIESC28_01261 [Fusarium coffeatum]RBR25988.1 hypothetical protein FIESC28_01261 [Fusarium coffeatum]
MERFNPHRRPREDEESQVDIDLSDPRWPLDLDINNIITIILQNDAKEGQLPEKSYRINFAVLQRIYLRQLKVELAKQATALRFGVKEPSGWQENLGKYIQALQNYDYMEKKSLDPEDPFYLSGEKWLDRNLLKEIIGNNADKLKRDRRKVFDAIGYWQKSAKDADRVIDTRRDNYQRNWLRGFYERLVMEVKPKTLIVGAGITGLSTAWWLDKAGWSTIIIERAPTIRSGGNVLHDNKGRELISFNYEDVHGGLESCAVCRGDLAALLAEALPELATIRFNEALDNVVEIEDGLKIRATLRSGEIVEADFLVGADGIRSSVRNMLWNDESCLEDLGLCYATYDVEQKEPLKANCVSFNSLGHLDILYRLRDDGLAALHIWRDDGSALQDRALGFGLLHKVIPGPPDITQAIDVAEKSGSSPIIDSLTLVKLSSWSKGRVLLLGDSAHCLTLLSGQGAGVALVSAEILGKELIATEDVLQALTSHEKKLRPTIERLQDRSKRLASTYIPKSAFMYYLGNLLMRFLPYSWIVSWHSSGVETDLIKEGDGAISSKDNTV